MGLRFGRENDFGGILDLANPLGSGRFNPLSGWWNGVVGFEACVGHGVLGFGVFHEGVPDEGGARVFGHEHGDAGVDAYDVGVVPFFQGIEGVDETVAAPGFGVAASDVLEDAQCGAGKERQGASGGGGNDGSIDGAHGGGATPDHVTFVGVRGGDSPEIVAVVGEALVEFDAEAAVD